MDPATRLKANAYFRRGQVLRKFQADHESDEVGRGAYLEAMSDPDYVPNGDPVPFIHGWQPLPQIRQLTLTDEERGVLDSLADAMQAFRALPVQHESDLPEFVSRMHDLQSRVMKRLTVRAHPKIFSDKSR